MKTKVSTPLSTKLSNYAWDAFCICSVIGIWPRYIEPKCLSATRLNLDFPKASKGKVKILHISDLHLNDATSLHFLKKIIRKKESFNPDFTLFTGDFFCRNEFIREEVLVDFFNQVNGKTASYCCFGNHDYTPYVTLSNGKIVIKKCKTSPLVTGFKKLFLKHTPIQSPSIDPLIHPVLAPPILKLLEKTPFSLLHNHSVLHSENDFPLRFVGLGDYWSGHFKPTDDLFKKQHEEICITLSHNPDSFLDLKKFPIDLILSGHTHGRQVNLPFIGKKLTPTINQEWARGLYRKDEHLMYTNRGLGGQTQFRWFSKPECTLITLNGK